MKAQLFLIVYAHRRRIKIWGTARAVERDEALLHRLIPEGYRARPEQVVLFTVSAWDVHCTQHIPQRLEAADARAAIQSRDQRIAELEAELEVEVERPSRGTLLSGGQFDTHNKTYWVLKYPAY